MRTRYRWTKQRHSRRGSSPTRGDRQQDRECGTLLLLAVAIEQQLSNTDIYLEQNKQDLQQLLQQRGALQSQLDQQESDWLDTQEQLEAMAQ